MANEKKWEEIEKEVREIAAFRWGTTASPEEIAGVRFDCVLRPKPNYWVLAEVSKDETLAKVRTDIAKFTSVRGVLFSKQIFPLCYLVFENEPTESMVTTGRENHVEVLSIKTFREQFFNYTEYLVARKDGAFGSAIDPLSGKQDQIQYVPISYSDVKSGQKYSIQQIADALTKGRKIILLGNFGTGKSRCIQELFKYMAPKADELHTYPICINLRENWGVRRAPELIRRAFDDLGVSGLADSALKIISKRSFCALLDGFDELGTQAWSENPERQREIRKESLSGVNELIKSVGGGLIVTGREHYFNSSDEMYSCLGLSPESTLLLRCDDEFSVEEMSKYLKDSLGVEVDLPVWLPRRPLMCRIISQLPEDRLESIFLEADGEIEFWVTLLDSICEREAQINRVLDAVTIKRVLIQIARQTREKQGDIGPLSQSEINHAFESVTRTPAVEGSALMLQRLPALGRIGAESSDRQFIDYYILDGLRANDVIQIIQNQDTSVLSERWKNPLRRLGIKILCAEIKASGGIHNYKHFLQANAGSENKVILGDLLSSIAASDKNQPLSLEGVEILKSVIDVLDLTKSDTNDFILNDSHIEHLEIKGARPKNVGIRNCTIQNVYGVTGVKGLPDWVVDCATGHFESVDTMSDLRNVDLSIPQRILVAIIQKTFFQKGSGRKEEALLRGFGAANYKKPATKILNRLMKDGILSRFQGNDGWVYSPNRDYSGRMNDLLTKLTLSDDPLWTSLDSN